MPDIKFSSLEGHDFDAYCARPATGLGPGLIVIHDNYGIDASMRQLCDAYAAKGFVAVCPNLFWRQPEVQLAGQTPKGFDIEMGLCDLISALGFLRKTTECTGKVGAVGYGPGGLLAYLLAVRSDIDSTVAYYPTGVERYLDEVRDIRMPMLLHFAGMDEFTPTDVRTRIVRSAGKNPVVISEIFQGASHAFARPGDPNFNPQVAEVVDSHTERFLADTLQS